MKSKATLQSFIAGLGWAVLSTTLHAADVFWDGGIVDIVTDGNGASGGTAGTWDTTLLNWDVGASPHVAWNNLDNDTAVFAGTGATVNITGTDVIVGGLTFNSAYTLNDAAAEKVVFGASGNISVTTGTTRIDSVVSETGGARTITKTGAGVLELQKANDFSGGLIISAGVVRANAGAATFGAAGTSITINGGEIHGRDTQVHQQSILLNATKTRFIKGNNGFWEFTGAVSGTGGLEVNDSGTYGARRLKFSSTSNTFTGEISMINNQALLHVNSLADTGGGDIVFDGSTAGFALGNGTASSITLSDRQIQITAGGGTNRHDLHDQQ
jgi:autotransporter-associated beta strand protein